MSNRNWQTAYKEIISYFFLYLFWPLGAFLVSLRSFQYKSFKFIFLLVAAYMGYCVDMSTSNDITRIVDSFTKFGIYSWEQIFSIIMSWSEPDFYMVLMSGVVSSFTSDKMIFSAILAVMYAFFYLKCLDYLISRYRQPQPLATKIFVILTAICLPYTIFNAARFNTALLIFLWGCLGYVFKDKKRYCFIMLCTPFVHFSFWILMPVPLLYVFFKKRTKIVLLFFLLSFLGHQFNVSNLLFSSITFFSSSVEARAGGYASEEGIEIMNSRYEELAKKGNVNRKIATDGRKFILNVFMLCMCLFPFFEGGRTFLGRKEDYIHYYNFAMLLWGFGNIASAASNGDRFYTVAYAFSAYFLSYLFLENKRESILEEYKRIVGMLLLGMIIILYFPGHVYDSIFYYGNWFVI